MGVPISQVPNDLEHQSRPLLMLRQRYRSSLTFATITSRPNSCFVERAVMAYLI
jgi:hypothetical protein